MDIIRAQHEQDRRADLDATRQAMREYKDAHEQGRKLDLNSAEGYAAAVRAGFSRIQINNAYRLEKALESAGAAGGNRRATQEHLQDIQWALQRRQQADRDQERSEIEQTTGQGRAQATGTLRDARQVAQAMRHTHGIHHAIAQHVAAVTQSVAAATQQATPAYAGAGAGGGSNGPYPVDVDFRSTRTGRGTIRLEILPKVIEVESEMSIMARRMKGSR